MATVGDMLGGPFGSWREGRLWLTVLWATSLAVVAGAWGWVEIETSRRASQQVIALVPAGELSEAGRAEALAKVRAEAGVAGARWSTPEELARRLKDQFEGSPLEDKAWDPASGLPWLLAVAPSDPLDSPARAAALAAKFAQGGEWIVRWDGGQLTSLAQNRRAARWVCAAVLLLTLLAGAGALLRTPWPREHGRGLLVWSALLGAAAPAAVWGAAWLSGAWVDESSLLTAVATGLVFSALAAPALRLKEAPGPEEMALESKEEASDERIRQDNG